jgi:hypothetical protein
VKKILPEPRPYLLVNYHLALSLFGPSALPQLMPSLVDPNPRVKIAAIDAVAALGPSGLGASSNLVLLMNDHPEVRILAMLALGQIGWKPTPEFVPILTRLLSDSSFFEYRTPMEKEMEPELVSTADLAAEMLGQIGPQAGSATGPLAQGLTNQLMRIRPQFFLALWRVAQDTNSVMILGSELEQSHHVDTYRKLLWVAGEIGPDAKPIVPAIFRGMTNFATDLSVPVRKALLKIDPQAITNVAPSTR